MDKARLTGPSILSLFKTCGRCGGQPSSSVPIALEEAIRAGDGAAIFGLVACHLRSRDWNSSTDWLLTNRALLHASSSHSNVCLREGCGNFAKATRSKAERKSVVTQGPRSKISHSGAHPFLKAIGVERLPHSLGNKTAKPVPSRSASLFLFCDRPTPILDSCELSKLCKDHFLF
jgi:hypothetical protein